MQTWKLSVTNSGNEGTFHPGQMCIHYFLHYFLIADSHFPSTPPATFLLSSSSSLYSFTYQWMCLFFVEDAWVKQKFLFCILWFQFSLYPLLHLGKKIGFRVKSMDIPHPLSKEKSEEVAPPDSLVPGSLFPWFLIRWFLIIWFLVPWFWWESGGKLLTEWRQVHCFAPLRAFGFHLLCICIWDSYLEVVFLCFVFLFLVLTCIL